MRKISQEINYKNISACLTKPDTLDNIIKDKNRVQSVFGAGRREINEKTGIFLTCRQ